MYVVSLNTYHLTGFPNVWYQLKDLFYQYRCPVFSLQSNFVCIVNKQEKEKLVSSIRNILNSLIPENHIKYLRDGHFPIEIKILEGSQIVLAYYRSNKNIPDSRFGNGLYKCKSRTRLNAFKD